MSDAGFSITYAGNGMFNMTVDGKTETFNIADMDIALRMEQVGLWDQEIADQYQEIKEANQKRKALNELLAQMRKAKSEGRDDDGNKNSWSGKGSYKFKLEGMSGTATNYNDDGNNVGTVNGANANNIDNWLDYFGITKTEVDHKKSKNKRDAAWDANIEAVKGAIDAISSDSEMMMLRFRQLVDKRGTALQEAKSTLQANTRLQQTITQS